MKIGLYKCACVYIYFSIYWEKRIMGNEANYCLGNSLMVASLTFGYKDAFKSKRIDVKLTNVASMFVRTWVLNLAVSQMHHSSRNM